MNQQSVTQEVKEEEKTRVLGFTAARQLTEQEISMVSGALKAIYTAPGLYWGGDQALDDAS